MKPLGLKPFHHKVDHRLHDHNHRKVANWWEAEQEPNKTAAKAEAKKEIHLQIQSMRLEESESGGTMIIYCDQHARFVDADKEPEGCKLCNDENPPEDLFWLGAYLDPGEPPAELRGAK